MDKIETIASTSADGRHAATPAERCRAANWQLAALLGWTELCQAGGATLGRPPGGAPASRGQARVPDWCGDWDACGPLMLEHRVCPALDRLDEGVVSVMHGAETLGQLVVLDFPSHAHAVRAGVVYAVIGRLKNRLSHVAAV